MTWTVTRFSIPLRHPRALGTDLPERNGFLLEVRDEDGLVGRGEASPPYWIDRCDLDALGRELAGFAATRGRGDAALEVDDEGTRDSLSPAATCAVETALLDLEARRRACSVAELLGAELPATLEIGALVGGDGPSDVHAQALERLHRGFRVLKLKVGGRGAAQEIERIRALRDAARGTAGIRLDANRAWDAATALEVLRAVADCGIEMVEEPLRDSPAPELARLRRETGVPIALDESVTDHRAMEAFAERGACDVVVLKLVRLGGPRSALAMAHRARELGFDVAWTDSIETRVGRQATLHAAAAGPGARRAVGLGGAAILLEPGEGEACARLDVRGPGLG